MTTSKDKNPQKDPFVEALRAIEPIPKRKNRLEIEEPALEAARPIQKRKNVHEEDLLLRLMEAMRFSSKDLAINREGELTEGQKKRLHRELLTRMLFVGGLAIFLVWLATVVAKQIYTGGILIVALLALAAGILALAALSVQEHQKKLATGHIVPFTGRVRKVGSDKQSQLMVIDYADETERIFSVGGTVNNAFVDGEVYTLYCPSFDQSCFVSAEPVSPEIFTD